MAISSSDYAAYMSRNAQAKPRAPRFKGPVSQRKARRLKDMAAALCPQNVQTGRTWFFIPAMRLHNPLNSRQSWRAVYGRGQAEKRATVAAMRGLTVPALPVKVLITRVGKRRMDSDGVAASAKHVRDSVAAAYGVDDGSDLFEWCYDQRIGEYGVEVTITARKVKA